MGGYDTATVTIMVNAVNDAPVAADDSATTDEDTSVTIDVLANDNDVDGDPLHIISFSGVTHGTLTLNHDGTVTFYPTLNFVGNAYFDYIVSDGQGGTDIASCTIIVLDKTPPITTLILGYHYIDESGTIYVTSSTIFTLIAIDAYSGIEYTNHIINGVEFEYTDPFTLSGADGVYTIIYYSRDTADNLEELKTTVVTLVSLKESSWLTDSDFNPITNFDFIFRKDNKLGGYTLIATNPGQFYYHIEVVNDLPITVDLLTIEAILPTEFITKGASPIHVYLNGVDITGSCVITGTTVYVTNVPSGSTIYITIHIDFDEKGNNYESLADFVLRGYLFNTVITGFGGTPAALGEGLYATHYSSSNLIAHQKKTTGICGFVTDMDGNPTANVEVLLLDSEGNVIDSTTTDPNGFYYFVDLELSSYKVQIVSDGPPITPIELIAVKDEFVEINFYGIDI